MVSVYGVDLSMKSWQARLLDDLVCQVYNVNLAESRDGEDFKTRVGFMMRNLTEISHSMVFTLADDRRDHQIRRVAESLRIKADRLFALSNAVPESFTNDAEWQRLAAGLAANYDLLRFEAGHLYRLVMPQSPFAVLKAAL